MQNGHALLWPLVASPDTSSRCVNLGSAGRSVAKPQHALSIDK
jgi:hypothetical protein